MTEDPVGCQKVRFVGEACFAVEFVPLVKIVLALIAGLIVVAAFAARSETNLFWIEKSEAR
jgi:biopolymer transport protein ExbD